MMLHGTARCRSARWLSACLTALVLVVLVAPTKGVSPDPAASEDLGAGLFDDVADNAAANSLEDAATPPATDQPEFPVAGALLNPLRQLSGGGQGGVMHDDWLREVTLRMRLAQRTLASDDASGRASAAQREAVNQLDALL